MIKRVGCVEIPVSDVEKSTAFYENVLDLKKTYEHPSMWKEYTSPLQPVERVRVLKA